MSKFIEQEMSKSLDDRLKSYEFLLANWPNNSVVIADYVKALRLLKLAEEALRNLLFDTEHKDHDCGEIIGKYCPVRKARDALAAIDALGKEHVVDAGKKVE